MKTQKFIYRNGPFYFEAEFNNVEELQESYNSCMYLFENFYNNGLLTFNTNSQPVEEPRMDEPERPKRIISPASEKQRKYMDKLGIKYNTNISMEDARILIEEEKKKKGWV